MTTPKRNITLDIARVFCMFWVICIWHFSQYLGHSSFDDIVYFYLDPVTYSALGTFFYISGLLLHQKYDILSFHDAWHFIIKRWLRIYPLYIIAAIFYLFTNDITPIHFIKGAFGFGIFNHPMTTSLWFIEVIIVYYMLYVVVWSSSRKLIIVKSIITYIVIIAIGEAIYIDHRFIMYYPFFILGMLSTPYLFKKTNLPLALFSLFVFAICYIFSKPSGWCYYLFYSIRILSGMIVILFMSKQFTSAVASSPKYLKWLEITAYLSMTAYIFHQQIIILFYHLWWPNDKLILAVYFITVIFPVLFFLSYYIQYTYDKILKKIVCF